MKNVILTFALVFLSGCGPVIPIENRLVSDEIITSSDGVVVLDDVKKIKENKVLYKVPTQSLRKKVFFERPPAKPEKFLIEMINLKEPGYDDLNDAYYERTVGKESSATIYILKPKKGDWSFVFWEGI